jgi:hypothetical protein
MNNEPVAWMHQNPDYPISKHWSQEYNIPLYTHPAKTLTDDPLVNFKPVWIEKPELTLTDEEIALIWDEFSTLQSPKDIKEFARAILRKAQE